MVSMSVVFVIVEAVSIAARVLAEIADRRRSIKVDNDPSRFAAPALNPNCPVSRPREARLHAAAMRGSQVTGLVELDPGGRAERPPLVDQWAVDQFAAAISVRKRLRPSRIWVLALPNGMPTISAISA